VHREYYTIKNGWQRVNKSKPCPVCGKHDWCLISQDGSAAICPRIESSRRAGEAGYLHKLSEPHQLQRYSPITIRTDSLQLDLMALVQRYQNDAAKTGKIEQLATDLGLSPASLRRCGVGWSIRESASIWPLSDATGRILGLNRRFANGSKMVMPGHKTGLYLPLDMPADLTGKALLITEGGTDTAAGLELGFLAVGRFSCTHGAFLLQKLIRERQPDTVVIIADVDVPGQHGADRLASVLLPCVLNLRVITPLAKDLRSWLQSGADHEAVMKLMENTTPRKLSVKIRSISHGRQTGN
jgi:phage/plasmid primase-like uncharacterized protein